MDVIACKDDHAHVQIEVCENELIELEAVLWTDVAHLTVDLHEHLLRGRGLNLFALLVDVHLGGLEAIYIVLSVYRKGGEKEEHGKECLHSDDSYEVFKDNTVDRALYGAWALMVTSPTGKSYP